MERERRREAQAVPAVPAPRFPARCCRRELRCGCRGAECSGARPGHRGGDGPAQPGSRRDPHLQSPGRSPGAAGAPLCPTAAGGPGRAGSCRELRGRSAFGQRCGAVPGSAGPCRGGGAGGGGRGAAGSCPGQRRAGDGYSPFPAPRAGGLPRGKRDTAEGVPALQWGGLDSALPLDSCSRGRERERGARRCGEAPS